MITQMFSDITVDFNRNKFIFIPEPFYSVLRYLDVTFESTRNESVYPLCHSFTLHQSSRIGDLTFDLCPRPVILVLLTPLPSENPLFIFSFLFRSFLFILRLFSDTFLSLFSQILRFYKLIVRHKTYTLLLFIRVSTYTQCATSRHCHSSTLQRFRLEPNLEFRHRIIETSQFVE